MKRLLLCLVSICWLHAAYSCKNPCSWLSACFGNTTPEPGDEQHASSTHYKLIPREIPEPISSLPECIAPHAQDLKESLENQEIFKKKNIQKLIGEYLGDHSLMLYKKLSEPAYMQSNRQAGSKAFFLPIVFMNFSHDGTQLHAVMSVSENELTAQTMQWNLGSGECIQNSCRAYWDIELECARPPKEVKALSPDGLLVALVFHQFYPNDDEFPAPFNGAYRPQYEATVNVMLKQKAFFAYVFSKMMK